MYVNRVRNTLKKLNDKEREEFTERLRHILMKEYHKAANTVKPSTLGERVDDFIEGVKPKIDYFEAYLLTLDLLAENGAIQALKNEKITMGTSWRQLLISITVDKAPSAEALKHMEDDYIVKEIKALFFNSIEFCSSQNKNVFFQNLSKFNDFIKIQSSKK